LASHALIQVYPSVNCNRSPLALNPSHISRVSTAIAIDQASASRLASTGARRGIAATLIAPTSGAAISTVRNGKSDIASYLLSFQPSRTASRAATMITAPTNMDRA
jgi:hypothetical protein